MGGIFRLLLIVAVLSSLTACCIPMHAMHGEHGRHQGSDGDPQKGEQKDGEHSH